MLQSLLTAENHLNWTPSLFNDTPMIFHVIGVILYCQIYWVKVLLWTRLKAKKNLNYIVFSYDVYDTRVTNMCFLTSFETMWNFSGIFGIYPDLFYSLGISKKKQISDFAWFLRFLMIRIFPKFIIFRFLGNFRILNFLSGFYHFPWFRTVSATFSGFRILPTVSSFDFWASFGLLDLFCYWKFSDYFEIWVLFGILAFGKLK